MKNYDDLQRFKDKTRTGAIDFKDMSAQSQQQSSGNWAIIKQLASEGDEQTLIAQGGSVSTPVPQSVDARVFESSPSPTATPLFAGLAPQQTETRHAPAQAPLLSQVPAPASVAAPVQSPSAPSAAPVSEVATGQHQAVRFDRLFATKGASPTGENAKDIPLQTLLETIASCR
ncbi:cellulose biosynthesis protein BcsO [Atlantibacter hermannii]|uniref:cellulose biosynthesis protein BcsO n=1 Tax=Atlantibacter hermannii TaxID=565 RepID=UPI002FD8968E